MKQPQVDPQGRRRALGLAPLHAAFEDVVVVPRLVACRVRPRQVQRLAQLGQENLVVGALGAAASLAPAFDEGVDIQDESPLDFTWPATAQKRNRSRFLPIGRGWFAAAPFECDQRGSCLFTSDTL